MSAIEERLTTLERRANHYRNTAVMIVVLVLSVGVGVAHTMSLIFKALQVFIGHAAAALLHVCTSAARCVSDLGVARCHRREVLRGFLRRRAQTAGVAAGYSIKL